MADQTASTSSNELKQKLAHHIEAARGKLDALKKDIANLHDADMQRLRQKRDEIHRRLDEQKDKARRLQAEIASWRREKVAHTQETVASWRQRREVDELRARADRAEQHSTW
jgi:peptidoglycan hydrolase CwlO-like protein